MKSVCPPKIGDVIFTDRLVYRHYGIYAGNGRVIHYASKHGHFGLDIRVRETSIENFVGDGNCNIIQFPNNKSGLRQFSGEETVSRARSRMGEKSYNLLFNNCEHFALWCKYGESKSIQVEKAVTTAVVLGAVAIAAYIAVESNEGV